MVFSVNKSPTVTLVWTCSSCPCFLSLVDSCCSLAMTLKMLPDTCFREKNHLFQGSSGLKSLLSILCCWDLFSMCCAKSLQSCLTLCNCVDRGPPGFSVHGLCQEEYSHTKKKRKKERKKKKNRLKKCVRMQF